MTWWRVDFESPEAHPSQQVMLTSRQPLVQQQLVQHIDATSWAACQQSFSHDRDGHRVYDGALKPSGGRRLTLPPLLASCSSASAFSASSSTATIRLDAADPVSDSKTFHLMSPRLDRATAGDAAIAMPRGFAQWLTPPAGPVGREYPAKDAVKHEPHLSLEDRDPTQNATQAKTQPALCWQPDVQSGPQQPPTESRHPSSVLFLLNRDEQEQSQKDQREGKEELMKSSNQSPSQSQTSIHRSSIKKSRKRRICIHLGCTKYVVDHGLCIGHGGGKRCSVNGCGCRAQNHGLCWKHGGFTICSAEGCKKRAKSRAVCWNHGGGTKCKEEGCVTAAVSHGLCWAHGGGRRCVVSGCQKLGYKKNGDLCLRHFAHLQQDQS